MKVCIHYKINNNFYFEVHVSFSVETSSSVNKILAYYFVPLKTRHIRYSGVSGTGTPTLVGIGSSTMSRSAINNTWTKDLKETLNSNVRKPSKEKKMSESSDSSRETSNSRKRMKLNEKPDADRKESKPPKKPIQLESDPLILQRRQKQIDYGKNTVGYHNYLEKVPISNRTKDDPKTPDKYAKYSRRSWDTLIKMWRKKLHDYDTGANAGSNAGSNPDSNPESDDEDEENENPSE